MGLRYKHWSVFINFVIMKRLCDLEISELFPARFQEGIVSEYANHSEGKFSLVLRLPCVQDDWKNLIADWENTACFSSKSKPHGTKPTGNVRLAAREDFVCALAPHQSGSHKAKVNGLAQCDNCKPKTNCKDGTPIVSKTDAACSMRFYFRQFAPLVVDESSSKSRAAAAKRLKDNPLLQSHPTEFSVNWLHSHDTCSLMSLRYRNIRDDIKEKMMDSLHEFQGSVCNAMSEFRSWLKEQFPTRNWLDLISDRSVSPTRRDWDELASKVVIEKYGGKDADEERERLKKLAAENPRHIKFKERLHVNAETGETEWACVIQTDLMRRSYRNIAAAKEVCFVDSTASVDLTSPNLTLMVTASTAGASPIVAIVHSHQTESCYQ